MSWKDKSRARTYILGMIRQLEEINNNKDLKYNENQFKKWSNEEDSPLSVWKKTQEEALQSLIKKYRTFYNDVDYSKEDLIKLFKKQCENLNSTLRILDIHYDIETNDACTRDGLLSFIETCIHRGFNPNREIPKESMDISRGKGRKRAIEHIERELYPLAVISNKFSQMNLDIKEKSSLLKTFEKYGIYY